MKSLLLMVTFLTRLPLPFGPEFDEGSFKKGVYFMPLVGLLLGGLLCGTAFLFKDLDPGVVAFLLILIYLLTTGGLHLDGLADTADGYLSYRDEVTSLKIMKDSRLGAFGAIALILYFLGMVTLLPKVSYMEWLFLPVLGRGLGLMTAARYPYAATDGMGRGLIDYARPQIAYPIMAIILISILWVSPYHLISALATILLSWWMVQKIANRLGGITGDVLGCVIEVTQVSWLFFAYLVGVVF